MPMDVTAGSTTIIPGVCVASVTVRIRLRITVIRSHVVPVRVIIVGCWIGVKTTRKSKTDSSNGGALSVDRLSGNESQSTYRQSNQENVFIKSSLSYFSCEGQKPSRNLLGRSRPSLRHKIGYRRSFGSRIRDILFRTQSARGRRYPSQKKELARIASEPAPLNLFSTLT